MDGRPENPRPLGDRACAKAETQCSIDSSGEESECIRAKGIPAEAYQNLADVLPDFSKSSAEKTVAFGSLYFIGEIKAFLQGKQ